MYLVKCPTSALLSPVSSVSLSFLLCSTIMGPKSVVDSKKKKKDNISLIQQNDTSPFSLDKSGNIQIKILAKPGAKQNAITDITSEGVGVQVNAPPVDGEANTELIKYLSKVLGLRKSELSLDRGSKSRQKKILINKGSCTIEDVHCKLKDCAKND